MDFGSQCIASLLKKGGIVAISRNIKKSNAPETTRTPEVRTHGSLVKSSPLDNRLGEARGGLRVIAMANISVTVPKTILSEPVGGAAIRVVRCCKWIPIVSHSYGGDVPTDAGESSHPLGGSYRKQAHVVVGDLSWSQDLLPGFSFPWASKLRQ